MRRALYLLSLCATTAYSGGISGGSPGTAKELKVNLETFHSIASEADASNRLDFEGQVYLLQLIDLKNSRMVFSEVETAEALILSASEESEPSLNPGNSEESN